MNASAKPPAPRRQFKRWLAPLVAFGLLAWVIDRNGGLQVLTSVVERLGWTWPLLLLPWSVNALLTILAYRTTLPERGRAMPFGVLMQVERAGSALNALLPLGNHGGQIIKVSVLRHWYRSEAIVSAGVWCTLGTGLSNSLAALGVLLTLALGFGETWVVALLAGVSVLLSVPSLFVVSNLRSGLSERVGGFLTRFPLGWLQRRREGIMGWSRRLDVNLVAAVGTRAADFRRLLWLRTLAQVVRVLEIWLVVALLGVPGGILTALLYNAMSRGVTQLITFIPGRLGVLELVSATVFGALGLSAEAGLAIALVLRFRYIVNLLISHGALARMQRISERFPPRARDVDGAGGAGEGAADGAASQHEEDPDDGPLART